MTEIDLVPLPDAPAQNVTDRVFETLHRAILAFDLPPGAKVSEADVARRLGVSRQPVRDAFFRLSDLGFLAIRPQRATLVTLISPRLVLQAVFIRTALEAACLRAAADRIGARDVDDLGALLDRQAEAVAEQASARFHDFDEAFHLRLCEVAGHGYAWSLIQGQKAHMDRVRFLTLPGNLHQAHREHRGLLDAVAARDPDLAEARLRAHLSRVPSMMPEIAKRHRDCFEAPD